MTPIAPAAPLTGRDVLLLDLDGVVYAAERPIAHAVEAITAAQREGIRLGYVTNNASRTAEQVASQLRGLGLAAEAVDVVTSPQAALSLLRELVPPPGLVLVVGGDGIVDVLESAGYATTRSADDAPAAVVQGFHASVGWPELAEASFAIQRAEIPWIATNQDWTLPHSRGVAPGNGTLVSAVHTATGRLPLVAGKPELPIFEAAIARFQAASPLMVGDRIDTDIVGARRAGIATALVLTGIDGPRQLLPAKPDEQPDYILDDLRDLGADYPVATAERTDGGAIVRVRDAAVRLDGDRVMLERHGSRIDRIRATCTLIWGVGRPIYGLDVDPELTR